MPQVFPKSLEIDLSMRYTLAMEYHTPLLEHPIQIDPELIPQLEGVRLRLSPSGRLEVASWDRGKRQPKYQGLGSFLLGQHVPPGQVVTYKNGDRFDFRLGNLTVALRGKEPWRTQESVIERQREGGKHGGRNRTETGVLGYRGVVASGKGFRARIVEAGVWTDLGTHATLEDAARAYDAGLVENQYAPVNFPTVVTRPAPEQKAKPAREKSAAKTDKVASEVLEETTPEVVTPTPPSSKTQSRSSSYYGSHTYAPPEHPEPGLDDWNPYGPTQDDLDYLAESQGRI